MPQPKHLTALRLRPLPRRKLDAEMQKYLAICEEKLGHLPNVLKAYSFDAAKLRNFVNFYNELMLGDSPLGKVEREMIAVVVSAANRCFYCLAAHGATLRQMTGDPQLAEMLVLNHRVAPLPRKTRAMLDFAHKLTVTPAEVGDADRARLRKAGFTERAIWDIAEVAAFFNFTNRLATATDMMPNAHYHAEAR
jgi:uncharacterized peroxidase-related enzyme